MKTLSSALFLFFSFLSQGYGSDIPRQKIELIQKAMEVMRVKSKVDGYIAKVITVKSQRIRNDNPNLVSDSLLTEIQKTIADIYQRNMDGNDGLYPQLYAMVDKYLTDDDLKFVMNYNASDGGQRYAKVAPRIVREALEVEKNWSEKLEPVVISRLKDRFEGLNLSSL